MSQIIGFIGRHGHPGYFTSKASVSHGSQAYTCKSVATTLATHGKYGPDKQTGILAWFPRAT